MLGWGLRLMRSVDRTYRPAFFHAPRCGASGGSQLELEPPRAERFEFGSWLVRNWCVGPTRLPSTGASRRLRYPITARIMSREPIDIWRWGKTPFRCCVERA